jgi:cytochrome c biogenesis protein CcmG/thiol:disulfide interchange protein DsbE
MNQRSIAVASILAIVIIAAAAIGWYVTHPSGQLQNASQAPIQGKALLGATAPQFAIPTTAGYFDLSKTDKPVFVEVFATWCPHCQRETAVIDKLYKAFGSRVAFIGVPGSDTAIDGSSPASQLDVLNWAQQFHAQYPIASYDPSLNVAKLYLQGGFPTMVVIGKDKMIAYINSGEVGYAELAAALKNVAG